MTKIFITSQFCQLVFIFPHLILAGPVGIGVVFGVVIFSVVIFGVVGVVIFGVVGIVVGQIGPPGISAGIYT